MLARWLHYILPTALLITAALVAIGGIYAASKVDRMVSLKVGSELIADSTFSIHTLVNEATHAEQALDQYLETRDPVKKSQFEQAIHHAWVHIGNLWNLNRNLDLHGLYYLQSALWALHSVCDQQMIRADNSSADLTQWRALRQKSLDELRAKATQLLREVTKMKEKNSDEKTLSVLSFRAAVFLTPILSALMLLIAFQYIYRVQRREREEAQAVNRAKSQFLANMSHEIRTPLAAVLGYSDMLIDPGLPEKRREECSASLKRNGHLLLKIVDDILDLSKIEARKVEFNRVDFNLGEMINDVKSTMIIRAAESGIDLHTRIAPSSQGFFHGDPVRIKQILMNIIGNAIKFTQRGTVFVNAQVDRNNLLIVEVVDSGIGISVQQIQRLFQPFTQADSATDRVFGGTGLGLSISRQLAQAMGGDVRVISSKIGKGSVFEISLQLHEASMPTMVRDTQPAHSPISPRWHDKSVLVVDDSEDNRSLVEFYLHPTGARVVGVASGDEALEKISQQKFDLILMDIQMPIKSGYETTRQIRQMGVRKPIIAFTAHAMAEEAARCRASGCDNILTKPVFRENLLNLLDRYL